ncbi:Universal stress protein A [BD1-7 clade bacterium]|uniref:Universal stress protein n=1 Tax=BD1-7 clade bacterium TaxID=2029982 RepID=A0A5S9QQJ3_9GAMM|nr:Universal stress protein A [BD1-7 clade bacterium]CAA0121026.1 Universal stress protein A [BD1-7 clade bacterium]
MYKKILVCLDLAGEPDQVLAKAQPIIEHCSADYLIVYCIEKPVTGLGELESGRSLNSWVQLKQEVMPHLTDIVAESGLDPTHATIEIGHIGDTLLDLAEEGEFDLILVGSHGRHGWRLLLGSTANAILHHAKMDVLAVRIQD